MIAVNEDQIILFGRQGGQGFVERAGDATDVLDAETLPDGLGALSKSRVSLEGCDCCRLFTQVCRCNSKASAQLEYVLCVDVSR